MVRMFYRCYSEVDKTSCKDEALASGTVKIHFSTIPGQVHIESAAVRTKYKQSHVQISQANKTSIEKTTNKPIVNNSQSEQKWHKDHKTSRLLMLVVGYSCDQLTG